MRRFLTKLIIFFILIVSIQMLIAKKFPAYAPLDTMQEVKNAQLITQADVLFLGDSSNYQMAPYDTQRRSIDQWIKHYAPGFKMGVVAHAGYGSDILLAHIQYMLTMRPLPKVVIVPINLGSFAPVWDRNPQFQFNEEKLILRENPLTLTFLRPLTIFKYTHRISEEEFQMTPVFNGTHQMGVVKDFYNADYQKHVTDERIKNRMAFRYMYILGPKHRKVKALRKISELLLKNDIKIIFYIGPIDWEVGERHWPKMFLPQMEQNVTFLKSLFTSNSIQVLDLSKRLEDRAFIDGDYPQEHINESGRQLIGKEIAKALKLLNSHD